MITFLNEPSCTTEIKFHLGIVTHEVQICYITAAKSKSALPQ